MFSNRIIHPFFCVHLECSRKLCKYVSWEGVYIHFEEEKLAMQSKKMLATANWVC